MRCKLLLTLGLWLSVAGTQICPADEILKKDGAKLVGKVTEEKDDKVFVKLKFGGVWIQRSEIAKIVKGPVPWEKKNGDPKNGPKASGGEIDFNLLQRVVYSLTLKYHPTVAKRSWVVGTYGQFMKELAEAKGSDFKLSLGSLEGSGHLALMKQYEAAARRRVHFWYTRRFSESKKLRVLPKGATTKKFGQDALKAAVDKWMNTHPRHQNPEQYAIFARLRFRLAYLNGIRDDLDQWSDKKKILDRIKTDKSFYSKHFFDLLGDRSPLPDYLRKGLDSATHPASFDTHIELTPVGAGMLGTLLAEIKSRIKYETVDGDDVLFDAKGFTGKFKLQHRSGGLAPTLFHRVRYAFKGKPMIDHYLFRIDKLPLYHVLVRGKEIWYAPLLNP